MKPVLHLFLIVFFTFLFGCSSLPVTADTYNKSNTTYNITKTVTGKIVVGDNSTLIFQGKGLFKDVTVYGKGITVVSNGSGVIFQNCNFKNATFKSSTLQATNFGLRGDMKDRALTFKFKGYRYNTRQRYGTDNTAAFQSLAQFLSGSSNVKIVFNGSFYSATSTYIKINDARNLQLSGPGTMVMGIDLVDCADCVISGLSFVGHHTVHDFPPVYASKFLTINGVEYNKNNSYNIVADGAAACGLAAEAIQIMPTKTDSNVNRNFTISNCHFEMRANGLLAGVRSPRYIVRDVKMSNCSADHIYFQPVGLHVSGATIAGVSGKYCLQGLDISAGSNNVTATNCSFDDCAMGPKQESTTTLLRMSHHNVIDRCTFGINEKYMIIDASQYIMNVAEGAVGDTFTVRNSTFNISKNRPVSSIMVRSYRTLLENVTFNVNVSLDSRSASAVSMKNFFSVYGQTSFEPVLELNNVTINLRGATTLNYLVNPVIGNVPMHLKATGLTVNAGSTISNYFVNLASVEARDCKFNAAVKNAVDNVDRLNVTRCYVPSVQQDFVVNKQAGADINIASSSINARSLVNCKATPAVLTLSGNTVSISGTEAIAGVNAQGVNPNKFKISGNTFNSSNRSFKVMNSTALKKLPSLGRSNTVR